MWDLLAEVVCMLVQLFSVKRKFGHLSLRFFNFDIDLFCEWVDCLHACLFFGEFERAFRFKIDISLDLVSISHELRLSNFFERKVLSLEAFLLFETNFTSFY